MGLSHSGFASSSKQNDLIQKSIHPSAPFSPSKHNTFIASAPFSPSAPPLNDNAETPYYEKLKYAPAQQNEEEDESPYAAIFDPYSNPYFSNIHQNNIDIKVKECTTPKLQQSNIDDMSVLAVASIPKQNQFSKIDIKFKYIKQLGSGASGRVLLVQSMATNKNFAMKELSRNNTNNHKLFLFETEILTMLQNNTNIVSIYDVYMDDLSYYIVMEYCADGDLLSKIISSASFSEKEAVKYIKSILEAVAFMHSQNIVHCDLKPNNMVFSGDHLKIIDFGQSVMVESDEKLYKYVAIGTTSFAPPELKNGIRSGLELKRGDSWSIGCVCFVMMTGRMLFGGNNNAEVWDKIISFNAQKLALSWPKNIFLSAECKDFIGRLLNEDVSKRLSVKDALKHEWITNEHKNSNKDLGMDLKRAMSTVFTKNKLQKILAEANINELDDNEKKILVEHVKDEKSVMCQLQQYHHGHYQSLKLHQQQQTEHEELMQKRAHYVMQTLADDHKLDLNGDDFKCDESEDIKQEDNGHFRVSSDAMSMSKEESGVELELEIDFEEYLKKHSG